MRIVLSTPPGKTTERWPPLGLLYIASSLRTRRPDHIQIIDAFCENLTPEALLRRVVASRPDVFGINCSTHTFLDAIGVLEKVRIELPETTLVLGGYHATFAAERILRDYPFVDYILKGEAEHTFPQLLDAIEGTRDAASIEGIAFLRNEVLVDRPPEVVKDLNALPFPARDLLGHVKYGYSHGNLRLTFGRFTTLCSSRGCPFRCRYCSCATFSQRRWRARSPENVVDEIEALEGEGYECAVFVDDNFTLNRTRVKEICGLLRARKIRMRFYCEGRVDSAPYELLRTMKQAGFDVVYFGVESVTDNVLRYYDKGITSAQSRVAIENAKRAGMLVVTSYILGAPVESREDIERTIDFIGETRPHAVQLNILDCLIGTPIWDEMTRAGVVGPDDWKRNHRIYEYNRAGLSRATLEALVEKGFAAYVQGWKSREGIRDLLGFLAANRTGRKVVVGNLLHVSQLRQVSSDAREKSRERLIPHLEARPGTGSGGAR